MTPVQAARCPPAEPPPAAIRLGSMPSRGGFFADEADGALGVGDAAHGLHLVPAGDAIIGGDRHHAAGGQVLAMLLELPRRAVGPAAAEEEHDRRPLVGRLMARPGNRRRDSASCRRRSCRSRPSPPATSADRGDWPFAPGRRQRKRILRPTTRIANIERADHLYSTPIDNQWMARHARITDEADRYEHRRCDGHRSRRLTLEVPTDFHVQCTGTCDLCSNSRWPLFRLSC